jgi:hypothetical protein
MSWPLNNPHSSSGYSKVRSDDNFRPTGGYSKGGSHSGRGVAGLQAFEQRRQEQNLELSVLDSGVTRLGELSLGISKEIDMQNRMIDNLAEDTEKVQTQADLITKQTSELIKKSGGPKTFCFIVVLSCILAFLTILVIYT